MTTIDDIILTDYIRWLATGEPVTIPDCGETHTQMIERISVLGRAAEVDEETFWFYLEVLPPRWMDGWCFCFAEGAEPLRLFWHVDGRHFCRHLSWDESHTFCDLADIPRRYYLY